jgi:hypothetical protein
MKAPTFPKPDTLTGRALMRLLLGGQFTHRDFQNETSSYRLSGYIESLRNRHHWPINSYEETAPTRDPVGRVATYVRYSIPANVLRGLQQEFGGRLNKFIEAVRRFEAGAAPPDKRYTNVSKDM